MCIGKVFTKKANGYKMTPEKAAEILTIRAKFMENNLPNHPARLPGVLAEIEALKMGVAALTPKKRTKKYPITQTA